MSSAQLTPAWAPYAPDSLKARFKPARERGAWVEAADTIAMLFGLHPAAPGFVHPSSSLSGLSAPDRALAQAEFDSLRKELLAGERDSAVRLTGNVDAKRFRPIVGVTDASVGLFTGYGKEIDVGSLPPVETRSLCWLALTLTDLATLYGGDARTELAKAYHSRATRWDNYSRRGYSMTPIELFANGYMPHAEGEPPALNLVLGHVSAGEQMYSNANSVTWRNLERRNVLVLEPAGFIRYTKDYSWYWGLTWVVSYPDSGGLSTGPMLHLKNYGHGAFLWRPKNSPGQRGALLLSLDLYRYLAGVPDKLRSLAGEAARDCLADVPTCVRQP